MEKLSLDEITDWKSFENLVAAYFETVKQDNEFNVESVLVQPTGTGADGGRDILVTFTVHDSVIPFCRKWVIQCKFHDTDISKGDLSDINIPSLLHEYGANGYLLVCKHQVTAPVSRMFEELNKNCWANRSYQFWKGDDLLKRVGVKDDLLRLYFPGFYSFMNRKESEADQLLNEIK